MDCAIEPSPSDGAEWRTFTRCLEIPVSRYLARPLCQRPRSVCAGRAAQVPFFDSGFGRGARRRRVCTC